MRTCGTRLSCCFFCNPLPRNHALPKQVNCDRPSIHRRHRLVPRETQKRIRDVSIFLCNGAKQYGLQPDHGRKDCGRDRARVRHFRHTQMKTGTRQAAITTASLLHVSVEEGSSGDRRFKAPGHPWRCRTAPLAEVHCKSVASERASSRPWTLTQDASKASLHHSTDTGPSLECGETVPSVSEHPVDKHAEQDNES